VAIDELRSAVRQVCKDHFLALVGTTATYQLSFATRASLNVTAGMVEFAMNGIAIVTATAFLIEVFRAPLFPLPVG
jgi:hypothetical protein